MPDGQELTANHAEQLRYEKQRQQELRTELEQAMAQVEKLQRENAAMGPLRSQLTTAQAELAQVAKQEQMWQSREAQYTDDIQGLQSELSRNNQALEAQRQQVAGLQHELDDALAQVPRRRRRRRRMTMMKSEMTASR